VTNTIFSFGNRHACSVYKQYMVENAKREKLYRRYNGSDEIIIYIGNKNARLWQRDSAWSINDHREPLPNRKQCCISEEKC